jgi:hypothetical protein
MLGTEQQRHMIVPAIMSPVVVCSSSMSVELLTDSSISETPVAILINGHFLDRGIGPGRTKGQYTRSYHDFLKRSIDQVQ